MDTAHEFNNEAERVISRLRQKSADLKSAIQVTRDIIRQLPIKPASEHPEPTPAHE